MGICGGKDKSKSKGGMNSYQLKNKLEQMNKNYETISAEIKMLNQKIIECSNNRQFGKQEILENDKKGKLDQLTKLKSRIILFNKIHKVMDQVEQDKIFEKFNLETYLDNTKIQKEKIEEQAEIYNQLQEDRNQVDDKINQMKQNHQYQIDPMLEQEHAISNQPQQYQQNQCNNNCPPPPPQQLYQYNQFCSPPTQQNQQQYTPYLQNWNQQPNYNNQIQNPQIPQCQVNINYPNK